MKTKKVVYATITAAILQVITLMVGLVIPRLLMHTFGSELNGLRASIVQIIGYIALVETGISGAITFELYRPMAERNYDNVNAILAAANKSYKKVGILFITLLLGMMAVYPFLIEHSLRSTSLGLIVLIAVPNVMSYFISSKYLALLLSDQLNYIVNICKMIYTILFNGIIVLVIIMGGNPVTAYLFAIPAGFVYNALIVIIVRNKYRFIDLKVAPSQTAMKKRYDVLAHQVSGIIVSGFPILLLTIYGDLISVSIYSVYMIVFNGLSLLAGVFNNGFTSGFGVHIAQNDLAMTQEEYDKYEYLYYIFMTVIYACVITLGLPFIRLYTQDVHDANYINVLLFALFVLYSLLLISKVPQTTIIQAAGQYKETKRYAITEAVITVTACIIFGYIWRLNGVLIGSIVGVTYRLVDINYVIKFLKLNRWTTIRRIIRMAAILVVSFLLSRWFPTQMINSYYYWVICGLITFILACIVTLVVNSICEVKWRKLIIGLICGHGK